MVVMVPRQRAVENAGRYDVRRREDGSSDPPGLLWRAFGEYISGLAFGAGVLTVATVTYIVGTALLL